MASFTTAMLLVDTATLNQYRFWAVGSVAGRDLGVAASVAPFLAVGAVLALASGRALNGLALGEDVARSLGQRVGWVRAHRGRLGGPPVRWRHRRGRPDLVRGPDRAPRRAVDHRRRSPLAAALLDARRVPPSSPAADVIGRVMVRPGELEVGIVTALVGRPRVHRLRPSPPDRGALTDDRRDVPTAGPHRPAAHGPSGRRLGPSSRSAPVAVVRRARSPSWPSASVRGA